MHHLDFVVLIDRSVQMSSRRRFLSDTEYPSYTMTVHASNVLLLTLSPPKKVHECSPSRYDSQHCAQL